MYTQIDLPEELYVNTNIFVHKHVSFIFNVQTK